MNDNSYSNAGRPAYEEPLVKETDHLFRDSPLVADDLGFTHDLPEWFQKALEENNWLTTKQFADAFGTHLTQVLRWCGAGLIHTAWCHHTYYEGGTSIKFKHYTYRHLATDLKGAHRRIPASELERCQFLKSRKRGCGREPRFKVEGGERVVKPELAPELKKWHIQPTEAQEQLQANRDQNFIKEHPGWENLTDDQKEALRQEAERNSRAVWRYKLKAEQVSTPDEDIDLSQYEEKN